MILKQVLEKQNTRRKTHSSSCEMWG